MQTIIFKKAFRLINVCGLMENNCSMKKIANVLTDDIFVVPFLSTKQTVRRLWI